MRDRGRGRDNDVPVIAKVPAPGKSGVAVCRAGTGKSDRLFWTSTDGGGRERNSDGRCCNHRRHWRSQTAGDALRTGHDSVGVVGDRLAGSDDKGDLSRTVTGTHCGDFPCDRPGRYGVGDDDVGGGDRAAVGDGEGVGQSCTGHHRFRFSLLGHG